MLFFLDTVAQLGFTGFPVRPGEGSVLNLSTSGKSFSERKSASLKFTERGLCLRLLTQPAVSEIALYHLRSSRFAA